MTRTIFLTLALCLLAGCFPPDPVVRQEPQKVELSKAILLVADELRTAQAEMAASGQDPLGMIPAEASFSFKIVAANEQTGTVEVGITPLSFLTAGGSASATTSASQENVITVKLSNLWLTNPATVAFFSSDSTRARIAELMNEADIFMAK